MEQNTATSQVRASSLALALVLLFVLGLLAMRAEAQEPTEEGTGITPVRAVLQENREERRALYEENRSEREELTDATPEARRLMLEEQRTEVEAWRTQARTEVQTALEERRTELQERIEERRAEWQERAQERKARLTEEAQERLGAYITRMTERMTNIVDQLASIADRIETRIEKIETEHGIDLGAATEALDEARTLIEKARGDVEDVNDLTDEALSSEDPKSYMEDVRAAAAIAKEAISAVHQALRDAVVEIKAGTPEEKTEEAETEENEKETTE